MNPAAGPAPSDVEAVLAELCVGVCPQDLAQGSVLDLTHEPREATGRGEPPAARVVEEDLVELRPEDLVQRCRQHLLRLLRQ